MPSLRPALIESTVVQSTTGNERAPPGDRLRWNRRPGSGHGKREFWGESSETGRKSERFGSWGAFALPLRLPSSFGKSPPQPVGSMRTFPEFPRGRGSLIPRVPTLVWYRFNSIPTTVAGWKIRVVKATQNPTAATISVIDAGSIPVPVANPMVARPRVDPGQADPGAEFLVRRQSVRRVRVGIMVVLGYLLFVSKPELLRHIGVGGTFLLIVASTGLGIWCWQPRENSPSKTLPGERESR